MEHLVMRVAPFAQTSGTRCPGCERELSAGLLLCPYCEKKKSGGVRKSRKTTRRSLVPAGSVN